MRERLNVLFWCFEGFFSESRKVFRARCIFFKCHAKEQERARKFGTYGMNSSLRQLYFLVSFASSRRAVSSSIDLDDTSDKYVEGFLRGTSSFRWKFGVPDVRISFKPVHGFICPPKYRCSFVADICTRVSAHSQIVWSAGITLVRLFVHTKQV